jgi:hypothetical protein
MKLLTKAIGGPTGPIPEGHVRVERSSYRYGQQGQTYLVHHDVHDLPELEAIRWLNGQFAAVHWPDGGFEHFDLAVSPARFSSSLPDAFGDIPGIREHVTLSRLPNVACGYHRPIEITEEQRAAFTPYRPEHFREGPYPNSFTDPSGQENPK